MKHATIPLHLAGATLADWAQRAQREGTTFVVLDEATPIATLVPSAPRRCTGAELAKILQGNELSPEEAESWARDIKEARSALAVPEDKWR